MIRRQPRSRLLGAVLPLLLLVSHNYAQTTFGSITGVVSDSSGAAIPNASVTVTNIGTMEKRTMETSNDGNYQFVNLAPGSYRVDVEKSGFKHVARESVTVEVQSTVRIDVSLAIGDVNQTVEVTAQTPLLQPETSSLGQVVDQRKTNELPLNGRNPMALAALVPSVVPQGQSLENPTGTNVQAWGNYQIGGGIADQNATYLDGVPLNNNYNNNNSLVPTQDSLQEFKVQTNNLSPEFGRFAGGLINFTTKSGTNELHGGAWEFFRNKLLNANDFFNNQAGIGRPAFSQNQFGFNLGGPIYIPRLYDGRNKTFFFVNYEGFRLRQGQSFTETVPTPAERNGDFSALGVPIYDPTTTCGVSGGTACLPGAALYNRRQFPGNVIPASQLNPTSLKLLNLYPLPNAGAGNSVNNFVTNASVGGNNNQTVVRIDQNISDKQHLSARYTYWGDLNLPIDPFKVGVCQDRCTETFNTNSFVLSDVYSLTPTTILDLRVSYQRFDYNRTPSTLGYDLTQLGWPASLNSEAAFRVLPVPCITGFDPANVFCSQGTGSVIIDRNDNYRAAGSVTKITGPHTLKFGGEFMRMTFNYAQTNTPTGLFNFDQGFTSSNPLNAVGGSGMASFLLGYASGGGAGTPAFVALQQLYPGLYANDDWHVTKKLTLNLGIRWEYTGPFTERFNRISYFNPTGTDPILQSVGLNYKGVINLVDSSGYGYRSSVKPDWKQFAPRLGVAYQITSKTVMRGGYGIFWLPNDVAWALSPNNDPINSFTTPYVSSINNGLTPYTTISNPFPGGIIQPPGRNPNYQQILLGQGLTVTLPGNPYGYAQQWNFDVQREVGNGFLLDVAYGGAKGTHLPQYAQQADQLPDQYLSLGTQLLQQVPNPFSGVVTSGALSANTVSYGQLLRPFPQYDGLSYGGAGIGNSSYNSLQVKAEKRFSNGASILVAYTFAKLISDTDSLSSWLEDGGVGGVQDWNNLRLERSLSSSDVPNRLVVSYVLDLPFGKGRKFLSNASGFTNQVIGGWGVEGVTTVQSGFPLHFTTAQNLTNSFGGGSRPNVTAGCDPSISGSAQSRLNEWFSPSCFSQPPAFTFGSEGRVDPTLRAAGIANWDFSTFKNFPFGPEGKVNLQFRAEFFNLFNRVQFGFPGQTFGTPQFGVVSTQENLPRLVQFALRLAF